MKRIGLLFCLFVLLISVKGRNHKQEQIRAAYLTYYNASQNKEFDKMIELTSSETIAYFDNIVLKARTLDSLKLVKESPVELTFILYLRQTLSSEEWKNYSGKDLLIFNVEKSLDMNSKNKIFVTKIKVRGKTAKCEYTQNKIKSKDPIEFKKENNIWKFNYYKTFSKSANENFYISLKKTNWTKVAFVEKVVKRMSGKRVEAKLWNQTIK